MPLETISSQLAYWVVRVVRSLHHRNIAILVTLFYGHNRKSFFQSNATMRRRRYRANLRRTAAARHRKFGCEHLEPRLQLTGTFGFVQTLDISGGAKLTSDFVGNIYLSGSFVGTVDFDTGPSQFNLTSIRGPNGFVAKYSPTGVFLWAKNIGGQSSSNRITSPVIDPFGNFWIAGEFSGTVDFDSGPGVAEQSAVGSKSSFLLKLGSNGDFQWVGSIDDSSSIGQQSVLGIDVDSRGNIYAAGKFLGIADFDPGPGISSATSVARGTVSTNDAFLLKLTNAGELLWVRTFGGDSTNVGDVASDVAVDALGNAYITGAFEGPVDLDPGPNEAVFSTRSPNTDADSFISRFDPDGNLIWVRVRGGIAHDGIADKIKIGPDGGVFTTGSFESTVDFDPGPGVANYTNVLNRDIYVSKLDSEGTYQWTSHFEGPSIYPDLAHDIEIDDSGEIYLTGQFGTGADFDSSEKKRLLGPVTGETDIFLAHLDQLGNLIWVGQFGATTNDHSPALALNPVADIVYLIGQFAGTMDFDPGANTVERTTNPTTFTDEFIVRLDFSTANHAPIITSNGSGTKTDIRVPEKTAAVADVDAADVDLDNLLTYSIDGGADSAYFSIDQQTGVLVFLTTPDFENPTDAGSNNVYDVTVQVSDGSLTSSQSLAIAVTNVNEVPTALNDGAELVEDGLLEVVAANGLLANDTDTDIGDTKTVVAVNGVTTNVGEVVTLASGAKLVLRTDGSYRFETDGKFEALGAGQKAVETFTYKMADGAGETSIGTVTIAILGQNNAPVARDDTFEAREGEARTILKSEYLANDSDVDSSVLTAAVVDQPGHGTVSLRLDGSFVYTPVGGFSGLDKFTYRVSDGLAQSNVATIALNVAAVNHQPVVELGSDVSLGEGQFFVANGSFSDPDSGESWTARVNYGDGSEEQPLVLQANKTFQLGHAYAENGNYAVTVSVRDSSGLSGSASFRSIVSNVAPQNVAWSGPLLATRGQLLTFVGGFSDPGAADTYVATVDWGDRSSAAANATKTGGAWRVNATHKYASGGIFQATLTVTDDDSGVATQSTTVMIVGARINGNTFELVGSAQRDNIKLSIKGNALLVNGSLGSTKIAQAFPLAGVQNIVAYLGEGNDTLTVDAKVKFSLLVNAGGGNDVIQAGGGSAVLIGGLGQDQLTGGGKSDLLIAGTTTYDTRPTALASILAEWSSGRPLVTRMENLRSGVGPVLDGLNVSLKAQETVFDDTAIDKLLGGGDLDWYWSDLKKDKITGKAGGEAVN